MMIRKAMALLVLGGLPLLAQGGEPPTVDSLQREILELRQAMDDQREAFEAEIRDLRSSMPEGASQDEQRLERAIQASLDKRLKFYRRPDVLTGNVNPLFNALRGGLILTGLFRSRFEVRRNNIDFNGDDSGLDDSGVRIAGRFRLGFGAVLVDYGRSNPTITALTEFQSVGQFANNSFANLPGPNTVPLPSAFNILTEPFEDVGLYQGYLNFEKLLDDSVDFKIGRQELILGNQFVLGNNEFYDGTVQDAARLDWRVMDGLTVTGFFAKEAASDDVNQLTSGITNYDEDLMAGVYLAWESEDRTLMVEGYALHFDARSDVNDLFLTGSTASAFDDTLNPVVLGNFWTLGARVFVTEIEVLGGTLSLNAEAAYQTGSNSRDSAEPDFSLADDQSIHGWSGEFIANFRIYDDEAWNPIITLAYYYAGGGDRDGGTLGGYTGYLGSIGFQPLFINRHFLIRVRDRDDLSKPYYSGGGRYGNQDQIPLQNIHIVKAGISFSPTLDPIEYGADKVNPAFEFGLNYILGITADDEGYGTGIYGHEFDLWAAYQYNDYVQFSASLSLFLPQDTAEAHSQLLFFDRDDSESGRAGDEIAWAFFLQALIEF